MIVEVTGVSSAGKSTALAALGAPLLQERLPGGLLRLPGRVARVALFPLAAVGYVAHPGSILPTSRTLWWAFRHSVIVERRNRWNGLLNAWQHLGLLHLARLLDRDDDELMLDTGPLHTVYNFFVDPAVPPDLDVVAAYLDRIPLADRIVQVTADRDAVVDRTLGRSNRRTRNMSRADAERFHDHALACFDVAVVHPRLAPLIEQVGGRMLVDRQAPDTAESG